MSALLVFVMTIAVGLLEVGELGEAYSRSLLKTVMITCSALFFMALVGFNTAFAPTIGGVIGNPLYNGIFLGGFSTNTPGLLTGTWWSMTAAYFNTGLTVGPYFLFEAAFASVTLALVGLVVLDKVKLSGFLLYSIPYFILIWNLPAAWIWNPTGWLYLLGMRDFAGGLVVHAAAGAAGLGILFQVWAEEKARGFVASPARALNPSTGWLTIAILLLWVGWFGFNPGSVLAFNESALVVVLTTFLAASSACLSLMFFQYLTIRKDPGLMYAVNGILMGLIVITPLAGFVSPGSAVVLGLISGPLYLQAETWFSTKRWFSDPIGLMPGHLIGGVFGVLMIAFFTQHAFAAASGTSLPDGLLFGGGIQAFGQLGIETFGLLLTLVVVFVLSYVFTRIIANVLHGLTTDYKA
ncbi:MAG: ammonium transporter [Thaumarchaeota archaeon]|nr:ammonium transporter [Nitrososphaerota archaeon]